jgi:hypothetical protein
LEVTQPLQATHSTGGESGTKNRATTGDQGCPWWPGRIQGWLREPRIHVEVD